MVQFMNPSNVYWSAPQYTIQTMQPMDYLGFFINIPYEDPVSTPMGYAGEGSSDIYGKRELVYTTLPEIFAVGGILPTTAGFPRINPNSEAARHSREHYTVRL